MARRTLFLLSLTVWFAGSFLAPAQSPTPTQAPPERPDRIAHVTLGQAAVPLYGPWKFTVGDSPIDPRTGKALWAEPDFDDSKWETVDLTPKDRGISSISGTSGYVPGWTAKGHPGYWGYAWYRIRVLVQARRGQQLALAGPANVDDAYQVFDNGELAGHFGDFNGRQPVAYDTQPKMFPLPQPSSHGAATGQDGTGSDGTGPAKSTRVLAFRLWMEPFSLIAGPDAGGLHSAPVLGEAGAVAAVYQMRWLEQIRSYAAIAAIALLFGLLAAAQAFGQSDDISVISVTRTAVSESAAA
jgi:hypothetical protein